MHSPVMAIRAFFMSVGTTLHAARRPSAKAEEKRSCVSDERAAYKVHAELAPSAQTPAQNIKELAKGRLVPPPLSAYRAAKVLAPVLLNGEVHWLPPLPLLTEDSEQPEDQRTHTAAQHTLATEPQVGERPPVDSGLEHHPQAHSSPAPAPPAAHPPIINLVDYEAILDAVAPVLLNGEVHWLPPLPLLTEDSEQPEDQRTHTAAQHTLATEPQVGERPPVDSGLEHHPQAHSSPAPAPPAAHPPIINLVDYEAILDAEALSRIRSMRAAWMSCKPSPAKFPCAGFSRRPAVPQPRGYAPCGRVCPSALA